MSEENMTPHHETNEAIKTNETYGAYDDGETELEKSYTTRHHSSWMSLGFLLVAFVLGSLFYQFVFHGAYRHTSALFIGIPLVLSIPLVLAPRSRSATGSILRGMILALLLVAPVVGEGYLCILFTAPLFLAVGLIIGLIADHLRDKRAARLSCIAVLVLPMCLEGVVPQLTHDRTQTVTVSRIIPASLTDVTRTLALSPQIAVPMPRFLRIGFPRPLAVSGSGLTPGSLRIIHFSGAEGDPPGDLIMQVTKSYSDAQHGTAHFDTISDSSKLTQWVRWDSSDVAYEALDNTHTRVTWTIRFDRQLDPWWYFAPWEQFTVHQATSYLLSANATPHSSGQE